MLRQIMLNKQKRDLIAQLEELKSTEATLQTRQEELAGAIEEAQTEEETKAVEEEVTNFENEKAELEEKKSDLEGKIKVIDDELEELNKKSVDLGDEPEKTETEEREEFTAMEKRLFGGITRDRVAKLTQREDVKVFLNQVREIRNESRAISGADLLIPEVLIGILRDNIHDYSKLITKVWLRPVQGKARMTIAGSIPEAIWTEACAKLNELNINFNQAEVDGYKVGGYIPVCNATLEDASDVDLYDEIMYMLAQAIGLAIDKAILYGTGVKMPLGIVTRLGQATKPATYSEKAREWVNLSTKNIVAATGTTGKELFADLIIKAAAAKSNFSNGIKTWVMNETTLATLQSKLVAFNAAGVVVAAMDGTMPILGGEIVILPFVPDGDIIGGYFKTYVLAERAGMKLAKSEHVFFIEDNTVFKGTARYDGLPVIAEAFVAINVAGGTVTKTITFAEDTANTTTPGA